MRAAVVSESGVSVFAEARKTPRSLILEEVAALAAKLLDMATREGYHVVGAAVVTPGIVDEAAGIVRYASNLGWKDVPLREELRARLGIPVTIGHDVRAAGSAEQLIGAGRGLDDILLVQIGTGVAAAIISGGRTITGSGGAAGEFGHIPIHPDGELCTCGQYGCLEVYVSGAGLARRYAAHGGPLLSSAQISARVGQDPIADLVWGDAIGALAQGLVIMTLLVDPALIVVGGGFTAAGDTLLDPLNVAIKNGLAWRDKPPIVLSQLGDEAGLLGAAVLANRSAGHGDTVAAWKRVRPEVKLATRASLAGTD